MLQGGAKAFAGSLLEIPQHVIDTPDVQAGMPLRDFVGALPALLVAD